MSKIFTLLIECENSAFEGDACVPEIASILRKLAARLDVEPDAPLDDGGNLADSNGNKVVIFALDEVRE